MKTFYSKSLSYILAAAILSFGWVNSFATKHTINVQNFFFSPSSLTINLGDTIVWQWISGIHTTTSLTIPAGATAWDSPIKSSVTKFTYVPAVLGTYNYKCTPHFVTKNMVGNFTVICPSASVSISAAGPTTFCKGDQVTLSQSSAGTFSTYQWQLDAVNISGATTSSYNATASGSHTLMVTSSCGSTATSNAVAVTVNKKPKADVTPAGPLTICEGGSVLLSVTTANNQTYQWKNGNTNIPGATNTTYLVTAAGDYKCKVTKTNTGCTKTSKGVNVTVTCKSVNPAVTVSAVPNPSSDYFLVNTSALSLVNGSIRIFDLTGKLLETYVVQNEVTSVGNNLPPGVYFARIETAAHSMQVLKLIKN